MIWFAETLGFRISIAPFGSFAGTVVLLLVFVGFLF